MRPRASAAAGGLDTAVRSYYFFSRHAQAQPDADAFGARAHEARLVARPGDGARRLRGAARGAADRLHHGHDDDERAREEGAPQEEGRRTLVRLPAVAAAAAGDRRHGARVRGARVGGLGGAAAGPPGRGAPEPRGDRSPGQAHQGERLSDPLLESSLRNLAAWSGQVAVLALVAASLSRLLPIERPHARLAFGQALLGLVVGPPVVPPWGGAAPGVGG